MLTMPVTSKAAHCIVGSEQNHTCYEETQTVLPVAPFCHRNSPRTVGNSLYNRFSMIGLLRISGFSHCCGSYFFRASCNLLVSWSPPTLVRLGCWVQEMAREQARASAEARRAEALTSQLQALTKAHGEARSECDRQSLRADHLESQLQSAVAAHAKELEAEKGNYHRETRELRAKVASLLGNQQYMESALDRARCAPVLARRAPTATTCTTPAQHSPLFADVALC